MSTNPGTTPRRAALYVRVSTNNRATGNQAVFEQNPDVQELPLRQLAEQRGWSVVKVYSDRMSGSKADRPGLKALMADARRGAFDVVLVWRFDRFARSIEQLVLALAEFRTLSIDFVSAQEALDTSTPMGKAMFTIVGAIAERERNVIRERIMAGLEHARSRGTKSKLVALMREPTSLTTWRTRPAQFNVYKHLQGNCGSPDRPAPPNILKKPPDPPIPCIGD